MLENELKLNPEFIKFSIRSFILQLAIIACSFKLCLL